METSGEREAIRESLFKIKCSENVLDMLRGAFVVTVLVTVVYKFSFENDAINSLEVHFDTTGKRCYEVVGHIHERNFTEYCEEVRDNRSANLQGSVVEYIYIAVVNFVEDVATISELDVEQLEAREFMEVECKAEVTFIEVGGLADEGQ